MTVRADEVDDPRSGQWVVFRRTGGDVLEFDLFVSRGAFVREHIHPSQDEIVHVSPSTTCTNVPKWCRRSVEYDSQAVAALPSIVEILRGMRDRIPFLWKKCPQCGTDVRKVASVCPNCGYDFGPVLG